MSTVVVNHSVLLGFASAVFERVGVPAEDAQLAAEATVEADLRGVTTHGVMRLPIYAKRISEKAVSPISEIKVVAESPGGRLVDGGNGLGQVISRRAMALAMDIASEQGVAAITVRNSNHAGVAGLYAEQATTRGMIGIYMTNGAPSMAPTGGCEPMLGSNPMAFGVPTGGTHPIVLDLATAVVARANLLLAKTLGKPIPLGWALDPDGRPTDDAGTGLKGSMLPFGGHKGYGLALIVDILGGVLSGGRHGPWLPSMYDDFHVPQGIGHFLLALNVEAFFPLQDFREEMDRLVERLKGSKKGEGVEEIFVPGEIEFRRREVALRDGIAIPAEVVEELTTLAHKLGVSVPFR